MGNKKAEGPAYFPMFLISKENYLRLSHAAENEYTENVKEPNYLEDRLDYKRGPSFRGPGKKKEYSTWFSSLLSSSPSKNDTAVAPTPGPVALDALPPPPATSTPKSISWNQAFTSARKSRKCPLCTFTSTTREAMLNHVQVNHGENQDVLKHFNTIQRKVASVKRQVKPIPMETMSSEDEVMEQDDGDPEYEDIPEPSKKRKSRPPKEGASPVTPFPKRSARFKRTPAKLLDFARPKRGRGYNKTALAKLIRSL